MTTLTKTIKYAQSQAALVGIATHFPDVTVTTEGQPLIREIWVFNTRMGTIRIEETSHDVYLVTFSNLEIKAKFEEIQEEVKHLEGIEPDWSKMLVP